MLSSHSPLLRYFLEMQLELINRRKEKLRHLYGATTSTILPWYCPMYYLQTWRTCQDQRKLSSHLSSRQFQLRSLFPRYLGAKIFLILTKYLENNSLAKIFVLIAVEKVRVHTTEYSTDLKMSFL